MLLGRGEDVQSRSVSGISPSLDIELFPQSAKILRLVIDDWEHPASVITTSVKANTRGPSA
jgi:hypothetical protein